MAEIVHGQCGHSLVGLLPGTTLSCSLIWGHKGRHSDGQSHWDTSYELDKAPFEDELKAAQATIQTLTLVAERAVAKRERLAEQLDMANAEVAELRSERDEARDEVARLNAVIVKLSGEKLRVALTDEQVDAARALLALVHYDDLAASWLDLLPPALGGPFGSRP